MIWRRTSFGSQTQALSTFFARMMTVVTTAQVQHRHVLEFMTQAVASARVGKDAPSLLPQVICCEEEQDFLNLVM